jgi:hypothetical protein
MPINTPGTSSGKEQQDVKTTFLTSNTTTTSMTANPMLVRKKIKLVKLGMAASPGPSMVSSHHPLTLADRPLILSHHPSVHGMLI